MGYKGQAQEMCMPQQTNKQTMMADVSISNYHAKEL